jgi:S1-C subfamily serine protease
MLARVSPAIVTITSSTTTPAPVPGSLLGGTPVTDIGSGIIFDSAGWIITNHHVVSGSGKLLVTTADGRQFAGTIYGIDTLTDLAIVKIDATGLPTATIGDSSTLAVGQSVVAIGDPEGVYPNSVTAGIVSALGRTIQVEDGSYLRDLIQTDAAINPGNSGGALLDAAGNVVGIPSATAGGAEGLGFAIPINLARPIMAQALAGQKLARPYMGIRYLSLTPQIAADAKLSVSQGAWLQPASADTSGLTGPAVTPGSPAATAGLQDNDVITAVNGVSIDAAHTLDDLLLQYAPGTSLNLAVSRGDTTITLHLTLGTRPAGL